MTKDPTTVTLEPKGLTMADYSHTGANAEAVDYTDEGAVDYRITNDPDRCMKCGLCIAFCPCEVLEANDEGNRTRRIPSFASDAPRVPGTVRSARLRSKTWAARRSTHMRTSSGPNLSARRPKANTPGFNSPSWTAWAFAGSRWPSA